MICYLSMSNQVAQNLASEEYLLAQDEECLFFYVNRNAVVVGANQVVQNETDLTYCDTHHITLGRRLSGGGAVFHDEGNLNYAFILNRGASHTKQSCLSAIRQSLIAKHLPVEIGRRSDLWVQSHKISGTASHLSSSRMLFHGTLLYASNLSHLRHALCAPSPIFSKRGTQSVRSEVTNISTLLQTSGHTPQSMSEFIISVISSLMAHYHIADCQPFTPETNEGIQQLVTQKYAHPDWIYRL